MNIRLLVFSTHHLKKERVVPLRRSVGSGGHPGLVRTKEAIGFLLGLIHVPLKVK